MNIMQQALVKAKLITPEDVKKATKLKEEPKENEVSLTDNTHPEDKTNDSPTTAHHTNM